MKLMFSFFSSLKKKALFHVGDIIKEINGEQVSADPQKVQELLVGRKYKQSTLITYQLRGINHKKSIFYLTFFEDSLH